MVDQELKAEAAALVADMARAGVCCATAESCTGGLIAGVLTSVPGSSAVFDRGFVTYSNASKVEMLGVSAKTLGDHGAVSQATAIEMAQGARKAAGVVISVAVTGVAGPGGGTATKPVGLVHLACAHGAGVITAELNLGDIGRDEVRNQTVRSALRLLSEALAVTTPRLPHG